LTSPPTPAILHTHTEETLQMLNYGDDGQIQEVDCDDVQDTIDTILEYVENRFEYLDKKGNRDADIFALCQEFHEWGTAEDGDEIGYLFLPRLAEK
jgi:hypothetical protein